MIRSLMTALLLVPVFAQSAAAASILVTPALRNPPGGFFRCLITNASPTKPLMYDVALYDYNGSAAVSALGVTLPANTNLTTTPTAVTQGHCAFTIVSGSKKSARISMQIVDAGGNILATVAGN